MGFCTEHTLSFIELVEGRFNVETDGFFDGDIVTLIMGGFDSVLHFILVY